MDEEARDRPGRPAIRDGVVVRTSNQEPHFLEMEKPYCDAFRDMLAHPVVVSYLRECAVGDSVSTTVRKSFRTSRGWTAAGCTVRAILTSLGLVTITMVKITGWGDGVLAACRSISGRRGIFLRTRQPQIEIQDAEGRCLAGR